MKDSLIIFACLIGGGLVGYFMGDNVPAILLDSRTSMFVIYILLFVIGLNLGTDMEKVKLMLKMPWIIWTLPVFTCIGSICGAAFMTLFTPSITGLEGAKLSVGREGDALSIRAPDRCRVVRRIGRDLCGDATAHRYGENIPLVGKGDHLSIGA